MRYKPQKIFVSESVKDLKFTDKILSLNPEIPFEIVGDDFEKEKNGKKIENFLFEGKKFLYLKSFKGKAFKLCPGFSEKVVCCNYHILDFIEHCPLECTYCILQAYLNHSMITFHVNVEEIIEDLTTQINSQKNRFFRVGTGEASDSLALDHLFGLNPYLIERFAKLDNALLELKTKTDQIDPLLNLDHNGRTIVSWSINAESITRNVELKTASLDQRIKAAKILTEHGYQVAFHFDPLIYFEDWETEYKTTVERIYDNVPAKKIAWISIGTLRYIPSLKKVVEKRFPKTPIFMNEFVPSSDGKMKYLKKIRKNLINTVSQFVKNRFPNTPLYLCMENSHIWQQTQEFLPDSEEALEKQILSNFSANLEHINA